MIKRERILGALYGAALGDAAGVPVEFRSRKELEKDPVKGFREGGTHGQPRYAWSDDTSLSLAQMHSLAKCGRVNLADQARRFLDWYNEAKYTSHGVLFDIGGATSVALNRLSYLKDVTRGGSADERCSGNGALMRILPLCIWLALKEPDLDKALVIVEKASSMTHRSELSIRCCQFYSLVVRGILSGGCVGYGMLLARTTLTQKGMASTLLAKSRLWNIGELQRNDIKSDGYVVSTLEAALWVVQRTKGVLPDILTAVNLGSDTDTTGCVAGGLSGLSRGYHNIPRDHVNRINRLPAIEDIIYRFTNKVTGMRTCK